MFKELEIPAVYTLEASFCGANKGQLAGKHFSLGNLLDVGKAVLRGLWAYKKTLLTKSVSLIKEINAEAETKFAKKEKDVDEGSSSEEEALPNKRAKERKSLLNAIKPNDK